MKYEIGKRYNLSVTNGFQEVTLIRTGGGLYTVKFDNGGAIRVHGSRLSEINAEPKTRNTESYYRSPWAI